MTVPLHIRGHVLPSGELRDVYVVGGRFTFSEPSDARSLGDAGWLLPGLVDTHAHLAMASPEPDDAPAATRVRASARAHLDAGVLLVREPGSVDHSSQDLGPHEGLPRVQTGGRFLAPPGSYFPGLARPVAEPDLAAAAAEELAASGAWAKVIGDWFGSDGRMRPNYSLEAMAEAATRVHEGGGRIAVHATCAATVERAIEAGFDSVEHGVGVQPDHLAGMAALGIALVPTLSIMEGVANEIPWAQVGASADEADRIRRDARGHAAAVGRAAAAGVTVLAGTDAGMVAHGTIRRELELLVAAGVPLAQAVAAASWEARRWLGLPGIEEGAVADLVSYAADPRDDADALAHPQVVVLDGKLIRS